MRCFDSIQIELSHAGPERLAEALQEYRRLRRSATVWLILAWLRYGIGATVLFALVMFGTLAPITVLANWFSVTSFLFVITALIWFVFFVWLGSGNKGVEGLWNRWKEEAEELSAMRVMHSDMIREIRKFQRDRR